MEPDGPLVSGGCLECGAGYGDMHWPGCGQAAGSRGAGSLDPIGDAIAECRRRGWSAAFVPDEGWRPCAPHEPGASADLGRHAFWRVYGDQALLGADGPPPAS